MPFQQCGLFLISTVVKICAVYMHYCFSFQASSHPFCPPACPTLWQFMVLGRAQVCSVLLREGLILGSLLIRLALSKRTVIVLSIRKMSWKDNLMNYL